MPRHCGAVRLRRVRLGIKKEERVDYCIVSWGLEASGALEGPARPTKEQTRVAQERTASMWGMTRETMNRLIGKYSAPDGRWPQERREVWSERAKARHTREGKQLSEDSAMRCVERIAEFFNKSPDFGQALLYSDRMLQELKPGREKRNSETEDIEKFAAAFGEECFPIAEGLNGDKLVPLYILHPNFPDANNCECVLGQQKLDFQKECPTCGGRGYVIGLEFRNGKWERAVLSPTNRYLWIGLCMLGIMDFEFLQKHQEELADRLGVDPNTFYKARQKFEWLGLLRKVPGDIKRQCSHCGSKFLNQENCPKCNIRGRVVDRKPDKLMYLPKLILDPEIMRIEWDRFTACLQRVRDENAARQARDLHLELHKAWINQQHKLTAFWNELIRRMTAAGIAKSVIATLYPTSLE